MPRTLDDATTERLKTLAAQEAAAAKDRLTVRTNAARLFAAATSRLAEAEAAWAVAQRETTADKAQAVEDLIGSGMRPADIADLLVVDAKNLRSLRTSPRAGETTEQT